MKVKSLSRVRLFATPWTAAHQALPSMVFFSKSTGVGCHCLLYRALTFSFSYLEPVCCSMSSSKCCFLTSIQVSQDKGQVVWYTHLLKNFPQFIVIHTVEGFGIVSKEEIDVFLELSCFFNDSADVGKLTSGSSAFSETSLNIWKFTVEAWLGEFSALLC